jgi:replicative DNA helicase
VSEHATQNLDAEEHVIGAILLAGAEGASARVLAKIRETGLEADDFYRASHGCILRAALELDARGEPADVVTLGAELERCGDLEEAGGRARLAELAAIVPATGNAAHYAELIRRKAVDRAAERDYSVLAEAARNGDLDGTEATAARARLAARPNAKRSSSVRSYDELLEQYAAERRGPELEPVRLGFGSIDADIRGVSAGQVCGIAARTAVGKSWALATIADTFAARDDSGSLVLSLEMPGAEWAERQLAIHVDQAPEAIEQAARRGELSSLAADFLARMKNARVVDDPLSLAALPHTFADARRRLDVPLRLVLIDYLGLLGAEGKDAYERASALGKGLKLLAKTEAVAIVVAMQVSRAGGDGSEPVTLHMLRDSGVLEESLDFMLGAWRPGKAANLTPPEQLELRDVLRVAVLKNRKGQDGRTVDLRFREASRRLYEPTEAV